MVFKKGVVYNPLGRGNQTEKQKKTAALLLSTQVNTAVNRIAKSLESPQREDHQWAVGLIMAYVFGKPKQEIEAKVDTKIEVNFSTPVSVPHTIEIEKE